MTEGFLTVGRRAAPFSVLLLGMLLQTVFSIPRLLHAQTSPTLQAKGSTTMREIATVETTLGSFDITLDRSASPRTVENFLRLAQRGYYTGNPIFHVLTDSLVFFGDPTGTGGGGESMYGRTFPDELGTSGQPSYRRGSVAMAHGPARDSNTSILFVCVRDAGLPPVYTVFGRVSRGMETIDRIGSADVVASDGARGGRPRNDIMITRITICTQNGTRQ